MLPFSVHAGPRRHPIIYHRKSLGRCTQPPSADPHSRCYREPLLKVIRNLHVRGRFALPGIQACRARCCGTTRRQRQEPPRHLHEPPTDHNSGGSRRGPLLLRHRCTRDLLAPQPRAATAASSPVPPARRGGPVGASSAAESGEVNLPALRSAPSPAAGHPAPPARLSQPRRRG